MLSFACGLIRRLFLLASRYLRSKAFTTLSGVAATTATAITGMQSGHIGLLLWLHLLLLATNSMTGRTSMPPSPNDRNLRGQLDRLIQVLSLDQDEARRSVRWFPQKVHP